LVGDIVHALGGPVHTRDHGLSFLALNQAVPLGT